MSIGAPLGLLALLALPVLVGIYLLRRHGVPRTVSALFLWQAPERITTAGPRLQTPRAETSLLLELGAVLAATAFLADLNCGGTHGERVVLVLDGGFSMQAAPTLIRVRESALGLVDDAVAVTVIESGAQARVLAGPDATEHDARVAIAKWLPTQASHSPDEALQLARELAGTGAVVFITDAPLAAEPPQGAEIQAVGEPLPNAGFVEATRQDGDATTVTARIANWSAVRLNTTLKLEEPDTNQALAERPITLEPGAEQQVTLRTSLAGRLRLSIPGDALPVDDTVELFPEPVRTVRVGVSFPADASAARAVGRFVSSASEVSTEAPPDLVFSSKPVDTGAWNVVIRAQGEKATTRAGPFFANASDPLLEDVTLAGVAWTFGDAPPGLPIVTSGTTALVSRDDEGRLFLNVDLSRSNLARTAAWPLLLANLVDERRRKLPGFARHNVLAGREVLATCGSREGCTLRNATRTVALPAGTHLLSLTPGTTTLESEGVTDRVSVLALDGGESDLRGRSSGTQGETGSARTEADAPRSALPLLVLLALLLADFAVAAPGLRRQSGVAR